MAIQQSVSVRNARLNAIETTVGTSPKLQIRTGAAPANCATASSGTMLCEMTLPSDWLADAASGAKALAGSWTGTGDAGAGAGTDGGHFRIFDSAGTTCHMQGTFGETADSPDMVANNKNIASGQTVTVTAFTLTAANA
jgi:hypothetical protein